MRDVSLLRGGVYTPSELHRTARRLERRGASVNAALQVIRQGQTLHLEFRGGRPFWSLSGERAVSAEVAETLINSPSIAPASGALFDCVPGQTWTWRHQ